MSRASHATASVHSRGAEARLGALKRFLSAVKSQDAESASRAETTEIAQTEYYRLKSAEYRRDEADLQVRVCCGSTGLADV